MSKRLVSFVSLDRAVDDVRDLGEQSYIVYQDYVVGQVPVMDASSMAFEDEKRNDSTNEQ